MRHETQNLEILDQFTKQAEAYAELTRDLGDPTLDPILSGVSLSSDDDVLDVACGAGGLTLSLAQVAKRVTGIDLTEAMIDQARALQRDRGIANVEWIVGDILPLPFEAGAFSVVVSRAAFHHFADPRAVLQEMARVCRPGGRIAVIDLTPDPDKSVAFDMVEHLRDPSHTHAFTSGELQEMGRDAGLTQMRFVSLSTPAIPLEAVLATSFPNEGDMERVRDLYRADSDSGTDTLGLAARWSDGQILVTYPLSLAVWRI